MYIQKIQNNLFEPKVSIIIPIHNTEKYLRECLDSVVRQSIENIEIICVDDASQDSSLNIVREYADKDPRFKVIAYQDNKSASQARKDGVLLSSGKYIMFLDADDTLEPNACEKLSEMMDKYKVDILQFGTYVDALPSIKESTVKFFTRFATPLKEFLYGKEVFIECFQNKKFGFTVWNKIYSASLCKKAFSYIKDGFFPKAQDLYAFFVLAWFAKSYYGTDTKFYHYNYGRGITGGAHRISLEHFERVCSQSRVADECKNFLITQGCFDTYKDIWISIRNMLINECVSLFIKKLEIGVEKEALDILVNAWDSQTIVSAFQNNFSAYYAEIVTKIRCNERHKEEVFENYIQDNAPNLVSIAHSICPASYKKVIPVVLATNDRYAPYAAVTIQSMIANADPSSYFRVYVLYTELSEGHRYALKGMSSEQADITCLNVSQLLEAKKAKVFAKAHFSIEAFYRFLIPEIFYFYDYVIYLDSDLVINSNLIDMMPGKDEMGDCLIAAVHNVLSLNGSKRIIQNFNLLPEEYFNSGVLIFNIRQWLLENTVEDCFEKVKIIPEKQLVCPDQDILNIVCQKRVFYLTPDWNYYWHLINGPKDLQNLYKSVIDQVGESFKILHYSSDVKPWANPHLPLAKYFWKYARQSVCYEEIIKQNFSSGTRNQAQYAKSNVAPSKPSNNCQATNNKTVVNSSTQIVNYQKRIKALESQLIQRERKIRDLKNSVSFKTGRVITFLPRRFRDTIVCYRKNGLKFTLGKVASHLHLSSCGSKKDKTISVKYKGSIQETKKVSKELTLGCSSKKHTPELIVSLTSFPARIETVHKTIATVLNQSERPDRVILWLAEEQFPNRTDDLPGELLGLMEFGLEIRWCHDIKSYKKLIPTLQQFPNAVIVTADDDVYYDKDWLKLLYESYSKWPNFIHCHRDTKFFIHDAEFKCIPGGAEKYSCPTYLHKLVGIGGVLYPPKSLHPDVLNENLFRTLAPTNDDIWFWLQAVRNNTKILVVEGNQPTPKYVEGTQDKECLKNVNDKGDNLFWVDFHRILNFYPEIEEKLFDEYKFVSLYEKLQSIKGKKREFYSTLDSQTYPAALTQWYREKTGEWLNLDKPLTFNDKIQWSKLYDSTELKTKLTDKVLVRQWISEKIGEKYLVPLLGVWDSFDQIDFDKLPNRFVLKTNHGSGFNYIVKDKKTFDVEDAREKFNKWMKINFAFNYGFELHYLNIVPKITAEEYIEQFDQVYDYKFFCFDGHLKFIWVDTDRYTAHKRTLFTPEWEKMSERIHWENSSHEIPKPTNFTKMIEISELLSKDFAHARIDFYEVDGRLFFGEITFTCGSGSEKFIPRDFGITVGNWFNLPKAQPIPVLRINSEFIE